MSETLDLEILLARSEMSGYQAELHINDDLGETRRTIKAPIRIDLEAMRQSQHDPAVIGDLLVGAFFADLALRSGMEAAIAAALPDGLLRLHLLIDPNAPELEFLRQELLLDPRNNQHLEYLPTRDRLRIVKEQVESERRINQRLRIALILFAMISIAAITIGVLAMLNNREVTRFQPDSAPASISSGAEQTAVSQAIGTATYIIGAAEIANRAAMEQQSTLEALVAEFQNQQRQADTRSSDAVQAAATANAGAERSNREAQQALQTAVAAQGDAQGRLEEYQRLFSNQLANAALVALEQQSDLAALLAAEAYCSADTPDARNALLTLLQSGLQTQIVLIPPALDVFWPVNAVAYSHSGEWIAWGAEEGPVAWRDTGTGDTFQDPPKVRYRTVRTLAFSQDERWLVSGGHDGSLVLRDLRSGEPYRTIQFPGLIHSLDIDPQNRLALAIGDAVWLWPVDVLWNSADAPGGEPLIQQPRDILSVAWDPAGRRLATGSADGAVRIYEPETGAVVLMEKAHTRGVRSVSWSPDGSRLASAGDDGKVVIWNPQSGTVDGVPLTEKTPRPLYGVSFSSDGRLLAAGGSNDELVVWDVASRQPVGILKDWFTDNISSLAFSPIKSGGRDQLVAGSISGQVALFSVAAEQTLVDYQLPQVESGFLIALSNVAGGAVQGLALTSIGSEVVAASPGDLSWQVLSPQLEPASAAAFSLNGATLALAPDPEPGQAYTKLLSADDWDETGRLDFPLAGEQTSPLFGLAFEPNGAILVGSQCVLQSSGKQECAPNQNHLQFQRTAAGAGDIQNVNVGENQPRLLAYDPTGRYLATGGETRGVQIWQLSADGQALQETAPIKEIFAEGRATALAFSLDGRLLAIGLDDWTLELWDSTSWQRLGFPQTGPTAAITSLAFDPAGNWLVAAAQDGSVQRWLVDPYSWAEKACVIASRPMSDQEWSLYFGSDVYNPACKRLVECKGK